MKTKVQMMLEVSKEQERNFLELIERTEDTEVQDIFKLIRGAEYRRGKEDGQKESIPKTLITKSKGELIEKIESFKELTCYKNPDSKLISQVCNDILRLVNGENIMPVGLNNKISKLGCRKDEQFAIPQEVEK